jgi:hypothetical protein
MQKRQDWQNDPLSHDLFPAAYCMSIFRSMFFYILIFPAGKEFISLIEKL